MSWAVSAKPVFFSVFFQKTSTYSTQNIIYWVQIGARRFDVSVRMLLTRPSSRCSASRPTVADSCKPCSNRCVLTATTCTPTPQECIQVLSQGQHASLTSLSTPELCQYPTKHASMPGKCCRITEMVCGFFSSVTST